MTAPSLATANSETTNSGQAGRTSATRSPASTPRLARAAAKASDWLSTSPKVSGPPSAQQVVTPGIGRGPRGQRGRDIEPSEALGERHGTSSRGSKSGKDRAGGGGASNASRHPLVNAITDHAIGFTPSAAILHDGAPPSGTSWLHPSAPARSHAVQQHEAGRPAAPSCPRPGSRAPRPRRPTSEERAQAEAGQRPAARRSAVPARGHAQALTQARLQHHTRRDGRPVADPVARSAASRACPRVCPKLRTCRKPASRSSSLTTRALISHRAQHRATSRRDVALQEVGRLAHRALRSTAASRIAPCFTASASPCARSSRGRVAMRSRVRHHDTRRMERARPGSCPPGRPPRSCHPPTHRSSPPGWWAPAPPERPADTWPPRSPPGHR